METIRIGEIKKLLSAEFQVGQKVTFKPDEEAHEATVIKILPNHFGDKRMVYHLRANCEIVLEASGRKRIKQPVYTFTSGKYIVESRFFEIAA